MYYLDEMKIADIAARLGITESAVKHRLYYARETIKKGVDRMENYTLKPIDIAFIGTGDPVGNDPGELAERSFSKSLVYLCKNTERSVKELSEELGVPMPFVEEEAAIQVRGQNGYYGLLRKTDNGKYISNFIIVDYDDFMKVTETYKKNTDVIAERFDTFVRQNEQKILGMPFLNKQVDTRPIAWPLIARVDWAFTESVVERLKIKYFSDISPIKRNYYKFGIATKGDQKYISRFYGCDGIKGNEISGYKEIFMSNMYGKRLQAHFHCGHNISNDAGLLLTIRAIGGLPLSSLSEDEKETAAKAIECGYIKKENNMLYPKILASETDGIYWNIVDGFFKEIENFIEPVVDEMYGFIKKYVPKHLMGEYNIFALMTSSGLLDSMIEKCIELGTLVPPENPLSAEGVIMTVKK